MAEHVHAETLPLFPAESGAGGVMPMDSSVAAAAVGPAPANALGSGMSQRRLPAGEDFDLHLLALAEAHGVGIQSLRALIDHYGDLSAVWEDDPEHLQQVLHDRRIPEAASVAADVAARRAELLA